MLNFYTRICRVWYCICQIRARKLSIFRLLSIQQKQKKKFDSSRSSRLFCDSNVTPEQIGAPGLRMFVLLHGEKDTDNLSSLRYAKYMKMASTTLSLKPEKLPPTNRAAYFYFLLVYYQVQKWNSLREDSSDAKNWVRNFRMEYWYQSWQIKHMPQTRYLKCHLCNCRVSSKCPFCGSRCFWRSNDLHCVAACGESVSLPQMILIKLKSLMMTCVILYLTICSSTTNVLIFSLC